MLIPSLSNFRTLVFSELVTNIGILGKMKASSRYSMLVGGGKQANKNKQTNKTQTIKQQTKMPSLPKKPQNTKQIQTPTKQTKKTTSLPQTH